MSIAEAGLTFGASQKSRVAAVVLLACLSFAGPLGATDHGPALGRRLPPALVASLAPGNTVEPGERAAASDRLDRIRATVADHLGRQVDCTCVQTIVRSQRRRPSKKFNLLDTLRLEVALIKGRETFSWPAASRFEATNIRRLVPTGSTSSGSFASHARNVFLSEEAVYNYIGEEALDGRPCFRYDYAVPLGSSDYLVKSRGHAAVVAACGSFWADAATLEIVRLEVNAGNMPPELRLESVREVIEYARVRIGEGEFLLPAAAQTTAVMRDGDAVRNEMRLSDCRRYVSRSVISFAAQPPAAPKPAPVAPTVVRLPAGVRLELQLVTPIDEERSKIGDRITAVVRANVKRNNKVVVPKGAVASGRIVRLENMPEREGCHVVALQFDTLEFEHKRANLVAELEVSQPRFRPGLIVRVVHGQPELWARKAAQRDAPPAVGVLHVRAEAGKMSVPRGAVLIWKTLPDR